MNDLIFILSYQTRGLWRPIHYMIEKLLTGWSLVRSYIQDKKTGLSHNADVAAFQLKMMEDDCVYSFMFIKFQNKNKF